MVALAERSGDDEQRAVAHDAGGMLSFKQGDLPRAIAELRTALDAAQRTASAALTARIRMHLVKPLQLSGADDEAAALLDAQAALLRAGGSYDERRSLLVTQLTRGFARQDDALIVAAANELLPLAEQAGDGESLQKAYATLAYAMHLRSDLPATRSNFNLALAMCERTNNPAMRANLLNNRASFETEIGQLASGAALACEAIALAETIGARLVAAFAFSVRAECALLGGDARTSLAHAETARAHVSATGDTRLLAVSLTSLGSAYALLGETGLAAEHLRAGLAQYRANANTPRILADIVAQLVEVLVDSGRLDEAAAAATELRELAAPLGLKQKHPMRIARALVREARARGDEADAGALYAEGRRRLAERLALLGDDAPAYAALPFNRL